MRKGIIYFFSILFGIIVGSLSGGLMAYHHPMKNIEGSWSSTDFLKTNENEYVIYTLASFIGRNMYISSNIYNNQYNYEGYVNKWFQIMNIKNTAFNNIMTAMTPFSNNDRNLHDYFQDRYGVTYPLFFFLDCNTIIAEELLGSSVMNIRLFERREKQRCNVAQR